MSGKYFSSLLTVIVACENFITAEGLKNVSSGRTAEPHNRNGKQCRAGFYRARIFFAGAAWAILGSDAAHDLSLGYVAMRPAANEAREADALQKAGCDQLAFSQGAASTASVARALPLSLIEWIFR